MAGPGFVYVSRRTGSVTHEGDHAHARRDLGRRTRSRRTHDRATDVRRRRRDAPRPIGGRATIKLVAGKATQRRALLPRAAQGRHRDGHGATAPRSSRADTQAEAKQAGIVATATVAGGAKQVRDQDHGQGTRCSASTLENATGAVVDNLGIVSVNVKSFAHARRGALHGASSGIASADLDHDHDRRERGAVAAARRSRHQGRTRRTTRRCSRRSARRGPMRRAWSCRRPIRPRRKDDGYPSRPVMPVLVEAQRKAAHAQRLRVLLDVRLDGRQGLGGEVVHARATSAATSSTCRARAPTRWPMRVFDALMAGYRAVCGPLALVARSRRARAARLRQRLRWRARCKRRSRRATDRADADDGGAIAARTTDGRAATSPGFLDAPAAALDALFNALAAVGARASRAARTLLRVLRRLAHRRRFDDVARCASTLAAASSATRGAGSSRPGGPRRGTTTSATCATARAARGRPRSAAVAAMPSRSASRGIRVFGERKGAQLWVETCADVPGGHERRAVRDPVPGGARSRRAARIASTTARGRQLATRTDGDRAAASRRVR